MRDTHMSREDGDRLCEDLLGVLMRIASTQAVFRMVECLGCGQLADPEQRCPHCSAMRLQIERRRERHARRRWAA